MNQDTAAHGTRRDRALDLVVGVGLFAGYLLWLLHTAQNLGYARDEGFYFHAARTYGKWFELLFDNPSLALERRNIDRYWRVNHEHPALIKSLFWASRALLEDSVFVERGTAYRFPGMVLSATCVATIYAFGRRCVGRFGGLVAALSFMWMPRVFYHSHLACFDMPITALCLLTVYAYYRSVDSRSLPWALAAGIIYGLALNTKHNSWLLPFGLCLHALTRLWPRPRERLRAGHGFAIVPLVSMGVIGPALFYATWPWIWHDTTDRLSAYVKFHTQHVYYNMEFLGRTYFEPPFPRSYAPLMTLGTVPLVTLLLAAAGGLSLAWASYHRFQARRTRALPSAADSAGAGSGFALLWALCVFMNYAPWLSRDTPIFGGTKHWMTAYPYLALFAGAGFEWARQQLVAGWPALLSGRTRLAGAALAVSVLAGPALMTGQSHPFGLSAYTPIVGGAPGAATLGLNRTFWGYTTGSVVGYLNASAKRGGRVYLHDTALDSFRMLQKDGRLRKDIVPVWTVARSHLALYHHEPHMSRVEYMIWVDYGTTAPAEIGAHHGVPVIWVYARDGYVRAPPR